MSAVLRDARPAFVVGAGGLLAGELLRLVLEHPGLALAAAVTREGCSSLRTLQPQLAHDAPVLAAAELAPALAHALQQGSEPVLFLALPHGASSRLWKELRATLGSRCETLCVVDLAADYRLHDPALQTRWYGEHADPEAQDDFAYGLPELAGDRLQGARRIAAPGCFATALQLSTLPAVGADLLAAEERWTYHGVTGSSGSGAKPAAGTHHPHRHANLRAYAVEGHRHEAELQGALGERGLEPTVVFVPCSGPFVRGIHLTAVLPLARRLEPGEARAAYAEAYRGRPFVEVLLEGQPELRTVVGSNRAALAVAQRGDALVVTCALDNVLKGGAGQAVQALNVSRGWPEAAGLPRRGLGML